MSFFLDFSSRDTEQGGHIIPALVFFDSFCEYPFFCGFTINPDDTGGYLECVYMFLNFCSSVYL